MSRLLSLNRMRNRVGLLSALLLASLASAVHAQSIITFDVPNASETDPLAINPAGKIVGSWGDNSGIGHGFLRVSRRVGRVRPPLRHRF
jgi:hypothetical protein